MAGQGMMRTELTFADVPRETKPRIVVDCSGEQKSESIDQAEEPRE